MSRIHEALKKAQQERVGGPCSEVAGQQAGLVQPAMFPAPEGSLPLGEEQAPVTVPSGAEARTGPLAPEALAGRCARHRWSPDPKTMLFFSQQNQAPGAEELRTLRSRLYQLRDKRPLRTVLITSPLPGEGKTFIAANLALVIVRQHERRAVLIDADLRWSRLHLSLGAPSSPGLSDYLRGEADEFSVLQRGPFDNLFFIPGGKPVSQPAELIANGRLKTLLHRLAPIFDWIILDSPPAIPVSDASLLADLCDGVLLVVQAATTPFDMAQRAQQEFRGKNLLGVVLNRVPSGAAYGSYYYHHYAQQAKNSKDKG